MSTDWEKIRLEYVTTNCSKSYIAEKYGVTRQTVIRNAKAGGWDDARERYVTGVTQKCYTVAENHAVDFASRLYDSSEKLLGKVNQLLELEDALSPRDLKSLTGALMDLKLLRDIKSEEEKTDDSNKVIIEFVNNDWDK